MNNLSLSQYFTDLLTTATVIVVFLLWRGVANLVAKRRSSIDEISLLRDDVDHLTERVMMLRNDINHKFKRAEKRLRKKFGNPFADKSEK